MSNFSADYWLKRLVENLDQPYSKSVISSPTGVSSGSDIFPVSLQTMEDIGTLRFFVCFGTDIPGVVLRAFTTTNTLEIKALTLLGTLEANSGYVFDLPAQRPFSYNLFPTETTTLILGQAHEVGRFT
jgi:hypothetical protein